MARRQQWIIFSEADPGDSGPYVLTCAEASNTLYVSIGGPPPSADPAAELRQVTVHTPAPIPAELQQQGAVAARYTTALGDTLPWRGQGGTGDRHDDLTVAKFAPPGPDVEYLDVRIEGEQKFAARLVRLAATIS